MDSPCSLYLSQVFEYKKSDLSLSSPYISSNQFHELFERSILHIAYGAKREISDRFNYIPIYS